MIQTTQYGKHHLHRAIERASQNPQLYGMDIAEFGVKDGNSLRIIPGECRKHGLLFRKVWGFDSFEGFPQNNENLHDWILGANKVNQIPVMEHGECIKAFFSDLSKETIKKYDIRPFSVIHIDSDLYISTIHAFDFIIQNNLLIPGTIVAFDEFKSTDTLCSGGESMGWKELTEKYKIHSEEFFRNLFFNTNSSLEWWQNTFIIHSVGEKAECILLKS